MLSSSSELSFDGYDLATALEILRRREALDAARAEAALPLARQCFPGLKPLWITASPAVLAARLAARGRESADDIAARLAASAGFRPPADCRVLCNDGELAVAGDELVAWLSSHCHQPITAL